MLHSIGFVRTRSDGVRVLQSSLLAGSPGAPSASDQEALVSGARVVCLRCVHPIYVSVAAQRRLTAWREKGSWMPRCGTSCHFNRRSGAMAALQTLFIAAHVLEMQ
jgi:hypothetical protein